MGDLGDLGDFLKEGNTANLDWLDIRTADTESPFAVDEEEYRKNDRLPKQNLDIVPDLEALWSHEDKASTTYLEPNQAAVPRTMGDMSSEHGHLRGTAEDILKTARFALMTSPSTVNLREQLLRRFTLDDLRTHRTLLASAIEERGLLGKVYIAAEDFPGCHNSPKKQTEFVRRFAGDAKYLQAKTACGGCIHAKKIGQATNCAVFHKQLVLEVPYSEQLATDVEKVQTQRGNPVQASQGLTPKQRIRLAHTAEIAPQGPAVYAGVGEDQNPRATNLPTESVHQQLIAASSLLKKKVLSEQVSLAAKPIVSFLRREMLKGRTATDLVKSLKVSFPVEVLAMSRSGWEETFKESGLYGAIYSTQDSFDDCREGADFLAKHNPTVRAMVAGSKCGGCIYNKVSRCMLYGKPLVKEASELNTWETVQALVQEHKTAGRIQPWETKTASWGETPRDALKALHARSLAASAPQYAPGRMDVFHAWAGGSQPHVAGVLVKRQIVKTAAKYLNEGLYGRDLLAALKRSFESRDLTAATPDLKAVIAEQGLQGIYYVDPAAYDDYGSGCKEASRLFRTKNVPYVKLASKCGSCVHNHNNHCSVINKKLVVEPPYLDKAAQQAAILATGPSTYTDEASLLAPSGLSMIQEYQLQNGGGMDIEVNEVRSEPKMAVEFGTGKIKL